MSTSIKNKAVRVRVTVGKQSGYVRDDLMNRDLEGSYGAHGRSVVHKKLFKTSKLFKEVQSSYTSLYNHYKENSLPWEAGARVIPSARVLDFANEIGQLKSKAEEKLEQFITNYANEVQHDLSESNGMMKQEDYPSPDELRNKFHVTARFMPISDADDFRVVEGLDDSDVENLVEQAKQEIASQQVEAAKEAWGKLYKVVAHMKDRVSEYGNQEKDRLHKSLLTNINDTITVLRKLNDVIGDDALTNVMDELERDVTGNADIEKLKAFKATRTETVNKVDEIMSKMKFFGGNQ
jgi:hypothetical protein